jgi:hypothetical protein
MKKNILETYRLLIELKNEKIVPERHEKDLERCIRNLEDIIEKNSGINLSLGLLSSIACIFKSVIDSP